MNGETQEPVQIPVLVSFLRTLQKELLHHSPDGEFYAEAIEAIDAIIAAQSGKRPEGAFGELYEALKAIGLDADIHPEPTTETIKP